MEMKMKKISKSTFWFCVTVVLFVGAVHSASVAQTADIDQNKDSGR